MRKSQVPSVVNTSVKRVRVEVETRLEEAALVPIPAPAPALAPMPAPAPAPSAPAPALPLPAPVLIAHLQQEGTGVSMHRLSEADIINGWKIMQSRVSSKSENGCYLCPAEGSGFGKNRGKSSEYDYRQISFVPGRNDVRPLAHVFSWYYWNMIVPPPASRIAYNPNLDISHRCGQHRCVNPEHLVQENPQMNQIRKGCLEVGSYTSCVHVPKCIGHKNL